MKNGTRPPLRLTLIYDPLCGWCYGATPSLRRLAQEAGVTMDLAPSGLFAGSGVRPMDDHFAEHAWANDQRIAALTEQVFSVRYRERVLADRSSSLDSGPAVMALTAVRQTAPEGELAALEAIQSARYVGGRDVTNYDVLAEILHEVGLGVAAAGVAMRAPDLLDAAIARMVEGRKLLRAVAAHGVPTLILRERAELRVISSSLLYGRVEDLLHHVRSATNRSN
ncbi:DsbA family protein [Pendulispora rubella]|uniref:DsbA family protein n=1 Tax=Pendulispora rubella TaxID=2741070 RepID=A0ABZ2L121_9BACT